MDALGHALNVQPVGKRAAGIVVIGILGVVDMVLLEGADEALYQAVWGGLTRRGHADLGRRGQQGAVGEGGILHPLVGVVDGRGWVAGQALRKAWLVRVAVSRLVLRCHPRTARVKASRMTAR